MKKFSGKGFSQKHVYYQLFIDDIDALVVASSMSNDAPRTQEALVFLLGERLTENERN